MLLCKKSLPHIVLNGDWELIVPLQPTGNGGLIDPFRLGDPLLRPVVSQGEKYGPVHIDVISFKCFSVSKPWAI